MSCVHLADEERDILSVRLEGVRSVISETLPGDLDTILSLDESGGIVGVQIIGAFSMAEDEWRKILSYDLLPEPLVHELNQWAERCLAH